MSTFTVPGMSDPQIMPDTLPIFPLSGVVLLPRARLPLNVFEPRYLIMVQDVLGQPGRMIGVVQPNESDTRSDIGLAKLYQVGCAGRITSFNETEDGRFLISLTGISRFVIRQELEVSRPYRMVFPDWAPYVNDYKESLDEDIDRQKLLDALKHYFKIHDIAADWNAVLSTPTGALVSSLVMICPFAPNEKQALLETPNTRACADMLITLLEMAAFPQGEGEDGVRH